MKIIEINKFHYAKRGADRHFLDLIKLLKNHQEEVAVFSMDSLKNEFSPWKRFFVSYVGFNRDDSTIFEKIKGGFRMFYSFEAKRKMRELLRAFSPNIVHIHNIYNQISPSILPQIKKWGIPIVMTVHDWHLICPDYLMYCNGQDWEKLGERRYFEFVKKKCFKNSYGKSLLAVLVFAFHKKTAVYEKNVDLFLAPSVLVKNKLVKGGFSEEKIVVLPHFILEEDSERRPVCSSASEKYAFYFGGISRDKGVDRMIDVFLKMNNDLKLYLAGKIEPGMEIPKNEKIKYLGFLNQAEVKKYLKGSLFAISFSSLPETFGLIALEALENGKPFLGLDAGAYGEIVENGKTGYICSSRKELEEKIQKLFEDDGLRILLSRNSLLRSRDFSGEKYYAQIMEIFRSLEKNKNKQENKRRS